MTFKNSSARDRTIDLVKSAAIWNVVLSHVAAAPFSGGTVGTGQWLSALFWASLTHSSVSLFLMASGALLLPPERELTVRKIYTRYIPRALTALFFWAACYKLVFLALRGSLTPWDLEAAAKNLLLFRHEEHLYYLHIMLLVYAFLPLTRLIAARADQRLLEYVLVLWFALGIVYPTVRTLWPFTLLGGIPAQWRMNMTYTSIGYTLLGYYLAAYHPCPRRSVSALVLLAGFLLAFGGTWAASAAVGKPDSHFLEGMGVGMFLVALGEWGLCRTISLPEWAGQLTVRFSNASFCVYLTHVFFLQAFARHGIRAVEGPVLLTAPVVSVLIIACCCGLYALLSRIPGVRKWLV